MGVAVDIYKLKRNWDNEDYLEIKGEKIDILNGKTLARMISENGRVNFLPFPYESAYYDDFPYSVITYKELKEMFDNDIEKLKGFGDFEDNYLYLVEWSY